MKEIFGVIFVLYGASGLIQSFRRQHTLYEILKAGRSPDELNATLNWARYTGIASLLFGMYLLA